MRTTVECDEFLSVDLECPARSINGDNPGIFKNGNKKVYRFLGVVVEPQERGDFLHSVFPFAST
jgi:hypothetical protein